MMSVLFHTLTLNAHKSVKLCELWTFYWYLCDLFHALVLTAIKMLTWLRLINFSIFATYEFLQNYTLSK